jgi:lipoprotein NlpD
MKKILILLGMTYGVLLTGCTSNTVRAPVADRSQNVSTPAGKTAAVPEPQGSSLPAEQPVYEVKKGETLFSIARAHGLDYRDLAAWNGIVDSGSLKTGQLLKLSPEGSSTAVVGTVRLPPAVREMKPEDLVGGSNTDRVKRAPKSGILPYSDGVVAAMQGMAGTTVSSVPTGAQTDTSASGTNPEKSPPQPSAASTIDWVWPAPGKIESHFVPSRPGKESNRGIDIAGRSGDPVKAAADGKIAYVGSSLRGYGNLIIIRHDSSFLSAYAHNSKIIVKEGDKVTKGQKIAEMGSSDAQNIKLHFEIRKDGKPVDPELYLPKSSR